MSHIIGLSSLRPCAIDMVYVQVHELVNETLFQLDRSLRNIVKLNPLAEWSGFIKSLENDGFSVILQPRDNPVFIHSRPWDEHLVHDKHSFFVSFPKDAPYELSEQLLFACNYAPIYASICQESAESNKLVLINAQHELVYADDVAWTTEDQTEKRPIGPVILIKDQFPDEDDYLMAKQSLIVSGYTVFN